MRAFALVGIAPPLVLLGCLVAATTPASADLSAKAPTAIHSKARAHAAGKRAKLRLLSSPYGPILFTGRGQALYLFGKDGRRKSNCYGRCASDWPPLKTKGRPIAGRRVRKRLIGTTRRAGGALQVTYRGHPLYTYAHEGRRQVLCHDVFLNGGIWLAVRRNGRPAPR